MFLYCCYQEVQSSSTNVGTYMTHVSGTSILYLVICKLIGSVLAPQLQFLSHARNVASLPFFYKYFDCNCSDELSTFVPRFHKFKLRTKFAAQSHQVTVKMLTCNRTFYAYATLFQVPA